MNEDPLPYSFFIGEEYKEVMSSLNDTLKEISSKNVNAEVVLPVIYKPEASFKVRPIT